MASSKQVAAARSNVRKAAAAAKRKRTLSKLPIRTRTALGKHPAKGGKTEEMIAEGGCVFAATFASASVRNPAGSITAIVRCAGGRPVALSPSLHGSRPKVSVGSQEFPLFGHPPGSQVGRSAVAAVRRCFFATTTRRNWV
jgi:hypothetical protein